jgi:hypothetical protein
MDKVSFSKIMTSIDSHYVKCDYYLSKIHTTLDLSKLTLAQAQELQKVCKSELSYMDKLCGSDLYHIIGMGNLTPPQMMQFTYAVRDYLEFRSLVKALAMNLEKISILPSIPVKAKYKLSIADITLESGEGEVTQLETASGAETIEDLPFVLNGKEIYVDLSRSVQFLGMMKQVLKCEFSESTMRTKMNGHSDYMGVKWKFYNPNEATGVFQSPDIYKRVKEFYDGQKAKLCCADC